MSETHRQAVHKSIDNLTDTTSWADLAKELDKYVTVAGDVDASVGGETIEMKDLMKSLVERHQTLDKNNENK